MPLSGNPVDRLAIWTYRAADPVHQRARRDPEVVAPQDARRERAALVECRTADTDGSPAGDVPPPVDRTSSQRGYVDRAKWQPCVGPGRVEPSSISIDDMTTADYEPPKLIGTGTWEEALYK